MGQQGFTVFDRRLKGLIDSAPHPMSTVETPNQEAPGEPAWSLGTALLFVVLWLSIQLLTLVLFGVAAILVTMVSEGISQDDAVARLESAPVSLAQLVASVGMTALSWIATFALMQRMLRRWPRPAVYKALGLVRPKPGWVWALTPVIGLGLLLAGDFITSLLNVSEETAVAKLLETPLGAVTIAVLAVGIAPIAEELFFRGFVLAPMARRFSLGNAMAFNGLVFALVHILTYAGEFGYLPPLFLFGFVLSGVRIWTGSILPGVLIHFIFNATSIIAFLITKSYGDT